MLGAAVFLCPLLLLTRIAGFGASRPFADSGRPNANLDGRLPESTITVDYPSEGAIFPPEITPPTFLWRDKSSVARSWRIDVSFGDGSPDVRSLSDGEPPKIGAIDPDCIADTNKLPSLTPQQAGAHTWIPSLRTWNSIKSHSVAAPATVTITGYENHSATLPLSRGRIRMSTSKDPVGAPIFYRDVPLMPTETEKGNIQPLAATAVRLIKWRLRNIGEPQSRVVLENIPMCANCHSFSRDGKTLGMDLDGPQRNKGMYTLSPLAPETSIRAENVIQWSTERGRLNGKIRVGFMSQVSPDGSTVVTTIDNSPSAVDNSAAPSESTASPTSNYYVANFKDYRFLQVFFPTRGILAWYDHDAGILRPLPGADDPRLVQMGAVWSPDGSYLVFARAEAEDPYQPGAPPARFANDPNERQMKYDLYRIPFNNGKGGRPEPIAGASGNGMSNTFPKVSPDGRWIVYVQCRNGQLMRPDSQLYIVPAAGGQPRRMRCNTPRMNSWHSFSPNGRWMVFSSKSRSPYTQLYLTHIDTDGNDSPPILIDNTTAANRAANIPEFVNVAADGLKEIAGPVIDYSRLVDQAVYYRKRGQLDAAIARWREALSISPGDEWAHDNLGNLLMMTGHPREAAEQLQIANGLRLDATIDRLARSARFDPGVAATHYNLGLALAAKGEKGRAVEEWECALKLDPQYADAYARLGETFCESGQAARALEDWRAAIRIRPADVSTLRQAAWVMATSPDDSVRNGADAVSYAEQARKLTGDTDVLVLDSLAAAYAETGRFAEAEQTAGRALVLAAKAERRQLAEAMTKRIALYRAHKPFRDPAGVASREHPRGGLATP